LSYTLNAILNKQISKYSTDIISYLFTVMTNLNIPLFIDTTDDVMYVLKPRSQIFWLCRESV